MVFLNERLCILDDLKMVAEIEVVIQQSVPILDVQFRCSNLQEVSIASPPSPPSCAADSVSADLSRSQTVSSVVP